MKAPVCPRTWEAEAIEDGRLADPIARASFERHAAGCEVCTKERRSLARIRKAVETLPEYPSQAIDRRRMRMALLQRANEQLMRGRSHRVGIWTLAACAIALAIVGVRWGTSRHLPSAPVPVPAFEVVEVGHASWTTTAMAGVVRVALFDGTTAVHVEHLEHDQEFLMGLPDGDLEVRGTRFQVSVVEKRTIRLEVTEGVVALRLAGRPQLVLTAGQKWSAPEPILTTSLSANTIQASPATSDARATADATLSRPNEGSAFLTRPAQAKELAVVETPSSSTASHPPSRAEASARTRLVESGQSAHPSVPEAQAPPDTTAARDIYPSCISAFQAGDYVAAERLLAAFVRDNPSDPRSEDAAFLLAVSHARMGDTSGAAQLAEDYLRHYPMGLRHKEAERLARDAGPSIRY